MTVSLRRWLVPATLLFLACECDPVPPEGEAGVPSASRSTLTASPSTLPADGESVATVTVTVLDAFGDPVAGVTVTIGSDRETDDVFVQPEAATDEDGVAVGTLTSTVAGTSTIVAQAGDVALEGSAAVVFEAPACPEGTEDCGEAGCQVLGSDAHCAACGDACPSPANAAGFCDEGACAFTCDEGFASCDDDPATGCESALDDSGECPPCPGAQVLCDETCVDLGSLAHCTDCEDACTAPENATATCTGDGCDWVCDAGYGACDDPDSCQPLGSLAHCTDCGDACAAPANATATCTSDGCDWACEAGFDTCEDDETCTPLGTVAHCEACGDACDAPDNATALCGASGCTFECAPGWGDCDGDPSTCDGELDGTGACVQSDCPGEEVYCPGYGCVDLGTVDHCLACGDACSGENATATCGAGGCELVCEGGFADCNQDAADGCEVDLSEASCCDDESVLVLTDTCLTAEAGGRLLAVVHLLDGVGAPVTGAAVSIDGGGLVAVGPVFESTGLPGAYAVELEAPAATGTFDVTATAEAGACGAPVAFGPITVEVVAPVAHGFGGTGGCSPRGGNLRVRVVDEAGLPIENAFVMIGGEAGDLLYEDPEAFLAAGSPSAASTATTGADGHATFRDYGSLLRDPDAMVTAGADGFVYASWVGFDAGDLVIALEPLAPIPERVEITGDVTGYRNASGIRLALVTQALDIGILSSFQLDDLLENDKTVSHSGFICGTGAFDVPGNIHFPDQSLIGCSLSADPADYLLSPVRGPMIDVAALQGDMDPIAALDAVGGSIADFIAIMRFRAVGLLEDVETGADADERDVAISSSLQGTMPVQASNAPRGDLYLLSIGDLDGLNGLGRLFLQGIRIGEDTTAHSATLTTADPDGPYEDVRHLAMAISLVEGEGASAILERTTEGRTDPRVLDDFFGTPVPAVSGRSFSWLDVSLPTSPADYHVSRSILRRMTPTGDYRQEAEPFWIVYAPAGVHAFELPDLPASAPRSADGGYLVPAASQQNRWFLGLYYQGLLADPVSFDPNDWAAGSLEPHLSHISLAESALP